MRGDGRTGLIFALVASAAIALGGCAGAASSSRTAHTAPAAAQPLPAAEKLGQDLLMVPVARDGRGCVQYRMQSARRPRIEAVFYRTHAGDFSTIEAEAACT